MSSSSSEENKPVVASATDSSEGDTSSVEEVKGVDNKAFDNSAETGSSGSDADEKKSKQGSKEDVNLVKKVEF